MFEYKVVETKAEQGWFSMKFSWTEIEVELNKLGQEGWELVNTVDLSRYQGGSTEVVFIFKREKR